MEKDAQEFLSTAVPVEDITLIGWEAMTVSYLESDWRSIQFELHDQQAHGNDVKLVKEQNGKYAIFEHRNDRWPTSLD